MVEQLDCYLLTGYDSSYQSFESFGSVVQWAKQCKDTITGMWNSIDELIFLDLPSVNIQGYMLHDKVLQILKSVWFFFELILLEFQYNK